eukprot:4791601-Pyramimonas_sp.AAC.1
MHSTPQRPFHWSPPCVYTLSPHRLGPRPEYILVLEQASGIAVEERLLTTTNIKADELVGLEGLLGVFLMAVVALPAANYISGSDFQGKEVTLRGGDIYIYM